VVLEGHQDVHHAGSTPNLYLADALRGSLGVDSPAVEGQRRWRTQPSDFTYKYLEVADSGAH
jgi:hypothetical protein